MDLQKVLTLETELNRYLVSKNIIFNVNEKTVTVNGCIMNLQNIERVGAYGNQKYLYNIQDKLYYKYQVECFLAYNGLKYSVIEDFPEIIADIASLIGDMDIGDEWKKDGDKKTYKIKFKKSIEAFEIEKAELLPKAIEIVNEYIFCDKITPVFARTKTGVVIKENDFIYCKELN